MILPRHALFLLLALAACPRSSDDTDTGAPDTDDTDTSDTDPPEDTDDTAPEDLDGDGHATDIDCDDADPDVHPGAEDACGDGVDGDCDGVDPRCPLEGEIDAGTRYDVKLVGPEASRSGASVRYIRDIDGDGDDEIVIGDERDDGVSNGRLWLLHGSTDTGEFLLEDVAVLVEDSDDDDLHPVLDVAGPGDLDGDGYGEILWLSETGRVEVKLGPFTGGFSDADADYTLTGSGAKVIAAPGDVTGNGEVDLVWSYPSYGSEHSEVPYQGLVRITEGPLLDRSSLHDGLVGTWAGEQCFAYAGMALASAGDYDGDGLADIVIGAPFFTHAGADCDMEAPSHAYVVLGPASETTNLADADLRVEAEDTWTGLGDLVASAGDLNGDGYDDVVFGEAYTDRAVVFFGPQSGSHSPADAPLIIDGEADTLVGYAANGGGDVDGDGFDDLLVSRAFGSDGSYSFVGMFYGPVTGTVSIDEADCVFDSSSTRWFGAPHAHAADGDINGDGLADVVLGSPTPASTNDGRGATFILFGAER